MICFVTELKNAGVTIGRNFSLITLSITVASDVNELRALLIRDRFQRFLASVGF
jgi:hypothetical protein